jgi:hypothetical protein
MTITTLRPCRDMISPAIACLGSCPSSSRKLMKRLLSKAATLPSASSQAAGFSRAKAVTFGSRVVSKSTPENWRSIGQLLRPIPEVRAGSNTST